MVSFERCQEQEASFTFQWFSNWEKSCKEVGTIWGHKKTKKGAFKILALQKIYKIYNAQFIGYVLISQKNIFQIHLLLKVSTFKTRIPDPGTARSMERSIFQPPLTQTPRFFSQYVSTHYIFMSSPPSTQKSERTAAQVPDDDALILFGCLDWRQAAQVSRSWTSQVRVYQLPVGGDGLASHVLHPKRIK